MWEEDADDVEALSMAEAMQDQDGEGGQEVEHDREHGREHAQAEQAPAENAPVPSDHDSEREASGSEQLHKKESEV